MNKYDKVSQFLGISEILKDREQMTDKEKDLFGHLFEIIEIYNEMKNLDDETLMMIIENAETKEEKDFFVSVSNYLLQEEQRKAVARGVF